MNHRSIDLSLFGRILLAAIFLMSGLNKVTHVDQTLNYMQSAGLTFATGTLLAAAIAVELGGGLMLLLGFKTRIAAAVLLLFLVPTTLVFHDFWTLPGAEMQPQIIHFLKNLAIMGGLAYVATFGAPQWSVDNSRSLRNEEAAGDSAARSRGHHDPVHGL